MGQEMKPIDLDEYPVHQAPLSMARVASTDRNFYDRCYFNAHDRTGDVFLVTGLGVYPNLGVVDAFATVRTGDTQVAVRFSDAHDGASTKAEVGGYRVEVIKPLQTLRLVCEHEDLSFDMTWEGAFDSVLEEHHTLMSGPRAILDATRFAQVGSWSGTMSVRGNDIAVDPAVWTGSRDRSWGSDLWASPIQPAAWATSPWWSLVDVCATTLRRIRTDDHRAGKPRRLPHTEPCDADFPGRKSRAIGLAAYRNHVPAGNKASRVRVST